MDNLSEPKFNLEALKSPNKILQTLKKIQFVMQFFVLSRYSQNSNVIAEFLMAIQAFKFYYKVAHFAQQQNLYMEHIEQKQQMVQQLPTEPLQRTFQLLNQIKKKPYRSNNFQPSQQQQLPCGKKIQLVTSVKVPENLKRNKLQFKSILGELLHMIRPLVSIIAIRLFGLNSYKSYLLSLAIDLFVMIILQRNMKLYKSVEVDEIQLRKRQIFTRYFFRRPLFLAIKTYLIEPLLRCLMKQDRTVYKLIMSILEMQSSITLTL